MTIERRKFGRTGHQSSAVLFGGAAGSVNQSTADKVLDLLLEYGVNHIDTAVAMAIQNCELGLG